MHASLPHRNIRMHAHVARTFTRSAFRLLAKSNPMAQISCWSGTIALVDMEKQFPARW